MRRPAPAGRRVRSALLAGGLAIVLAGCSFGESAGDRTTTAAAPPTTAAPPASDQAQPAPPSDCPPSSGQGAEIDVPDQVLIQEWKLDAQNIRATRGCVTL